MYNDLINYIYDNYNLKSKIHKNCLDCDELVIENKDFYIFFEIYKTPIDHFLYNKCNYVIDCTYSSRLCVHEQGYSVEYNFENVDKFLCSYFKKHNFYQLSLF